MSNTLAKNDIFIEHFHPQHIWHITEWWQM